MTVSLHDLIKEWEVVNEELYRASLESHKRYPFPGSSYSCSDDSDCVGEDPSSTSPLPFSTTTYARVYSLLSRTRHIAEDPCYNSFYIIQHLLWVTIVAWANQMASMSDNFIRLPIGMRQYHESSSPCTTRGGGSKNGDKNDDTAKPAPSASTPLQRTSFPCALLQPLEFWDPSVLGEMTDTSCCKPDSLHDASLHRAPNLPEVWSNAVQRIFALWCSTPTAGSRSKSAQTCDMQSARGTAAPTTLQYAHTWVIVAQHYHRFKSLLSLFFLRYDVLLEDAEEQRSQEGGYRSGLPDGQAQRAETNAPLPASLLLRRRGGISRGSSFSISPGDAASATEVDSRNSSTSTPAAPSADDKVTQHVYKQARVSSRLPSSSLSTANLLGHLMRSIANENLSKIYEVTREAILSLLLPRVHRARLRHQSTIPASGSGCSSQLPHCALPQDNTAMGEADTAKEASSALTAAQPPAGVPNWHSDEHDEDHEDDDLVVWSSPPSPLLAYTAASFGHDNGDAPAPAQRAGASATTSREGKRVQHEEYVIRSIFKLLLMIEDCRVHALQRWLVESSKRVAFFYGSQLAMNLFDDATPQPAAFAHGPSPCDPSVTTITTTRTLADANRVLRETLQAYVRLRAKLLFLNAGTTHFLDALTPWGRTRMLESLNAFLCGFCGIILPSDGKAPNKTTALSSNQQPNQAAASPVSGCNESVPFTPMNTAVADFAQKWGVPLWVAMCSDAQQRMEALRHVKEERSNRPKNSMALAESEYGHVMQPAKYQQQQRATEGWSDKEMGENDHWSGGLDNTGTSSAPVTSSLIAAAVSAGDDSHADKPDTHDRHSVASTELEDAVSHTTSVAWPPRSPTVANGCRDGSSDNGMHRHGGVEETGRALTRRRGRGLDLKRVLHQQQQRRARLGDVKLPQRGITASRSGAPVASSEDGGEVVESLYTGETTSAGEDGSLLAAAMGTGNDGSTISQLHHDTSAAATGERQRGGGQDLTTAAGFPMKRFSRSAELHQVATLPDEGFPCLLYLMPRRSRFVILDKAAAAVQQQLFTCFSANVQAYLTDYLAECETAAAAAAADQRAALASQKKKRERAAHVTTMGGIASCTNAAAATPVDIVRPFPHPVLARMTFLLEMTYAALHGRDGATSDSRDDHTEGNNGSGDGGSRPPLMETGLTATGQELGAALLEQCNGEFDSVVSTTLSAPKSPALLTIAAVRKGFQCFLTSLEKRASLTLAQALCGLVQQGATQQPPAAQLDAVDTILNMASLLNSKDMFVMLLKGYLAPQIMMCRSKSELVVELQVVDRMAYRLGAAVAAPCLTLLRDLQLAISDPRITIKPPPPSGARAGLAKGWKLNVAHETLSGGNRKGDGDEYRSASSGGVTEEYAQRAARRDSETLDAVHPSLHCTLGLIHHVRVLCRAWWQPHTAVLLTSRRLRQLWERHQLLDERVVDSVLSVEWKYDGHSEPFRGYGQLVRLREGEDNSHLRPPSLSDGGSAKSMWGSLSSDLEGDHSRCGNGGQNSGSLTAGTQLRTVTAAAVVRGFSSALGNAVRRTGRQAGDFGYHDSDNESEDYREAYGGLLTLSTLQQYRNAYAPSSSSYRGSNLSSIGSPGAGGEHWGASDGRQSTTADDRASTTVPADGQLVRRRLYWPLGDGQLVFYLFSKGAASAGHSVSQAVQIFGPPLTYLICQLLDRASEQPYTFGALHGAFPVQVPKPLLAHILHELVKANVVVRSVAAGTRQLTYLLCDDTRKVRQRKVIVDVRAATQQQWVTQMMTMTGADAAGEGEDDNSESSSARDSAFLASPKDVTTAFSKLSPKPAPQVHLNASAEAEATPNAAVDNLSSLTYSVDCTHKIKVCIVRIMKVERVLSHCELVEHVALALKGQLVVTPSQLKRCVTQLIEREFLQRGEQGEYIFVS
ncbi:conserved hypothetical protein [Leishmania braziliensis MHOM/BR/75/M2904]|uniref:Cullin neddylation domain-containing protein n=2 Tax=Leishmania braziliensis TaxID=5660 RepID=A4HPA7_LEIBR|nr:conserved hypothetical protein [Leishmania braziliensis MHOM/BR/75/M2904]CAJ2481456.1 unnamed protein product [Leishmania braziliensis]CAM44014.2 conserved hypothetical protein [Leishmania braziliensis MHOM/BR/75/M2904]SYZ70074.1 Cullin_protein_neddylation_domain_containing_protein [Leishmania braziliensis MHOM/BR/75/M2904]